MTASITAITTFALWARRWERTACRPRSTIKKRYDIAGDLRGLVQAIIGEMPFYVVNTHAHFDHASGNLQFDRVYCHEYEAYNLQAVMKPDIWDYLFDENGSGA